MRPLAFSVLLLAGSLLADPAAAKKCKPDAAQVGGVCVDLFEASVWEIPPEGRKLIKKVQQSKISSAAALAGAAQRGLEFADLFPGCPSSGNGCTGAYAVSIPGVTPARYVSWFQAAAACRNAGKRLATNQEWQMAALGTPDPGVDNGSSDCNIEAAGEVLATGSRSGCVSDTGHRDMVGNVSEWVADWGERAAACQDWDESYGDDRSCVGGDGSSSFPTALVRGGSFGAGAGAGVFAASTHQNILATLDNAYIYLGFRCARDL
jgi:formylglycine-generating enzyme required for sulfatase activity